MVKIRSLLLAVIVLVSGCCEVNSRDTTKGQIVDISFEKEHREGVKPAHDVAARWWLNVCVDGPKGACKTLVIYHAPFSWQTKGSAVTMYWLHNDCSGWWLDRIENPEDTRQFQRS